MQKPPMKYSENECLWKAAFSLTLCKGSYIVLTLNVPLPNKKKKLT